MTDATNTVEVGRLRQEAADRAALHKYSGQPMLAIASQILDTLLLSHPAFGSFIIRLNLALGSVDHYSAADLRMRLTNLAEFFHRRRNMRLVADAPRGSPCRRRK